LDGGGEGGASADYTSLLSYMQPWLDHPSDRILDCISLLENNVLLTTSGSCCFCTTDWHVMTVDGGPSSLTAPTWQNSGNAEMLETTWKDTVGFAEAYQRLLRVVMRGAVRNLWSSV